MVSDFFTEEKSGNFHENHLNILNYKCFLKHAAFAIVAGGVGFFNIYRT
jgi:hypothetical protein